MQDYYLKARENFAVKAAVGKGLTITRNYDKIWGTKEKKGYVYENEDKKDKEEKKEYKRKCKQMWWYLLWSLNSFLYENYIFYFFPLSVIVFPIVDLNSSYFDFNS